MCVCAHVPMRDREGWGDGGGVVRDKAGKAIAIAMSGSAGMKFFSPLELTMNGRCYWQSA